MLTEILVNSLVLQWEMRDFIMIGIYIINNRLYENLRPVVPMLVELLKDLEEKTRANAAGALGNFVRNSNELSRDLIKHGALHQLLEVVKND